MCNFCRIKITFAAVVAQGFLVKKDLELKKLVIWLILKERKFQISLAKAPLFLP